MDGFIPDDLSLCVLIEIKTRGGIDADQVRRHEQSHFGPSGATLRNLDLRWRSLSRAIFRAYQEFPNPVLTEFLAFLSAEGLSATLTFDGPTVFLSHGKLPSDVTRELAERVRSALRLDAKQLRTYAESQPQVLIFTNFDSVGNIEVWLDGEPPDVNVRTLISLGYRERTTRLQSPVDAADQIERLLQNLGDPNIKSRAINTINAITPAPFWTILDRLVRAQAIDWNARDSATIAESLSAAGRPGAPDAIACLGDDHQIPGHELDRVALGLSSLHRAGQIRGGEFNHFSIFARAYLGDLTVPAFGRSPQDVVPQVAEHCLTWYRVLRGLSGV